MKIAIITERIDIELGGAERSVSELFRELGECGLKPELLVAKGRQDSEQVKVLCPQGYSKRTNFFRFRSALKAYLAEKHYDIVHSVLPFDFADVYQPRGGSYAEAAIQNAASYQNKLVSRFKLFTGFTNFRRSVLLLAEKRLCKKAAGPVVLALSNYVKDQFVGHYGLSESRIVVIPNGVKIGNAADGQAEKVRGQLCSRFGLAEKGDSVFFLLAANNFRLKGLSSLINAVHRLKKNKPNAKAFLIIVGSGPREKYESLAANLGISERILFLGYLKELGEVMRACDVAVLPSYYDPCSRFILEALAANKPVITTKFNGAADLFVNGRHGKVIDNPGDVGALAAAMEFYTVAGNIRKSAEAIEADRLEENISIERHTKELIGLYESIVAKRKDR